MLFYFGKRRAAQWRARNRDLKFPAPSVGVPKVVDQSVVYKAEKKNIRVSCNFLKIFRVGRSKKKVFP